ncbi:MAG: hypothetical protein MZV70_10540 [Desulfobacterales bacterium]|nr:hypothetical protein [Desulfobacterales bacterium]
MVDVSAEFRSLVVDYFTAAYNAGLTPNPCAICNPAVKFGAVLRFAQARGAGCLGDRALCRGPAGRGRPLSALQGRRPAQGPVLLPGAPRPGPARPGDLPAWGAHQGPGPGARRAERAAPGRNGREPGRVLRPARSAYEDFVQAVAPASLEPGPIETVDGRLVGRHAGLSRYTVGQRRGINCPAAAALLRGPPRTRAQPPWWSATRQDLLAPACRVERINWIAPPPEGPVRVQARVRYRTPEAPATVTPLDRCTARVEFDSPQSSVTPGQAAVFYDGTEVLGGGFIARAL